jgi:hypothetical protein
VIVREAVSGRADGRFEQECGCRPTDPNERG